MKVGDRVMVLDDALSGTVISIVGDVITIADKDDFEIQFAPNELVVVTSEISKREFAPGNVKQVLSEKQTTKNKNLKRIKSKDRNLPPMEVDLHIHHLVKSERGLGSHEMLEIQIATAKRQLNFAIGKKIQRIVFIHGVGEGVLRTELEYLFRQYDNVVYEDADFQKYGRGATQLYIFQNKKLD